MSFFNNLAKQLLDHIFTDVAYLPPTNLYIGLSSTTPGEDGSGVLEPSVGAYARVLTTSADWSAATDADPSQKTTTAVKTFPTATADWATAANMTHFVLFDHITASAATNKLCWGPLTVPKPVLLGDTASFAAGALIIQLD